MSVMILLLLLLAVSAFALPLLLFERSLRRARHKRDSLLHLEAQVTPRSVRLRWRPLAINRRFVAGFELRRVAEGLPEERHWDFAENALTTFDDLEVEAGRTYRYRLQQLIVGGALRPHALQAETVVAFEGVRTEAGVLAN